MTSGHFKVATIWRDDGERRVLSVTDEGADNKKNQQILQKRMQLRLDRNIWYQIMDPNKNCIAKQGTCCYHCIA